MNSPSLESTPVDGEQSFVSLELTHDLKEKLLRLRRLQRTLVMSQAVVVLASLLALLWLFQGVADSWLSLPWLVRAILLASDAAALIWIYRHFFPSVFKHDPSLAAVALLAEKRWPELRQCLISAVELSEGKPGATSGSPQLSRQVILEARTRTDDLDFNQLVPWTRFGLWLAGGVLVTVISLATMVAAWPISGILLERILLSTTTQTIVIPITKNISAPIGSDVVLSARAVGRIPDGGHVTVTYTGESSQDFPITPDPDHPALFSLTVHSAQKSFTYRFHLNDGESPLFSVDVETPPALASIAFKVIYPAYTGLPPEDRAPGNLSILAGSHLQIDAVSAQSLASATIQLNGLTPPQTIAMTCDAAGNHLTGDIPIPVKGLTGFSIHLVNRNGFPSSNDTVYPVYPVPDLPPVLHLVKPNQERATIIAQAQPHFLIQASDDYGVAKLTLNYQVTLADMHATKPVPQPVQEISIPFDPGKSVTVDYTLQVAAQTPPWPEGATIDYWVEATDNNDVTGPGVTRTKHFRFEVVSLAEKEREISERLRQAANSLDSVAGQQDKVSNQVSDGLQH